MLLAHPSRRHLRRRCTRVLGVRIGPTTMSLWCIPSISKSAYSYSPLIVLGQQFRGGRSVQYPDSYPILSAVQKIVGMDYMGIPRNIDDRSDQEESTLFVDLQITRTKSMSDGVSLMCRACFIYMSAVNKAPLGTRLIFRTTATCSHQIPPP